jgi:myo-inositol-1-phosphate synthase
MILYVPVTWAGAHGVSHRRVQLRPRHHSILAAPLALDLMLFSDLTQRAGLGGIQEWLSFCYRAPMVAPDLHAEHDLFIQLTKLKNTLRWMMGEDQITHLGCEYYDGH